MGRPCTTVLARPSRLCRSPLISVAMLPAAVEDNAPVFDACTVRSRTLRVCSSIDWRAESVVSSHPVPSEMFRAAWSAADMSERACIARLVPVGESDGVLIERPEVSCCCSRLMVSMFLFRFCRLVSAMERWVTRIRSQPHSAGAVDQLVEALVDARDHPRGRGVGVLELEHVGHLLVE